VTSADGYLLICAIDHLSGFAELLAPDPSTVRFADAVSTHEPAARERAIAEARSRLDQLNALTRQYGRPYTPSRPLDEVVKELPAEWYRTWH
jgi:hypothetical protein